MRNTLIAGVILLALLVVFVGPSRSPKVEEKPQQKQAQPQQQRTASVRSASAPFAEVVAQTNPAPANTQQAQDTPEARQVEQLLAAYGFNLAALPAAYDYAYEFHRLARLTGPDGSEQSHVLMEGLLDPHRRKLDRYGAVSGEFLTNLVAIQPTVFWPQKIMGVEMPQIPQH